MDLGLAEILLLTAFALFIVPLSAVATIAQPSNNTNATNATTQPSNYTNATNATTQLSNNTNATSATTQPSNNTTSQPTTTEKLSAPPDLLEPIEAKTYNGSSVPITLDIYQGWEYVISTLPSEGKILGVGKKGDPLPNGARYEPFGNFTGLDAFTYNLTRGNESRTGIVSITVGSPAKAIIADTNLRIAISFVIASFLVAAITFIAASIIRRLRLRNASEGPLNTSRFSDIIRGHDFDPSLSIFQFLLWTFVLMFAITSVYFIRILGGVSDPPQAALPVYLLAIAGISVATPIASTLISSSRYPSTVQFYKEDEATGTDTTTKTTSETPVKRPSFGEMFREFGKPTLSRYQMFAWTWISIIIYLSAFITHVVAKSSDVINLAVPDIDPLLVALMGLSQIAFLGVKTAVTTEIEIVQIYPLKIRRGEYFSIFGKNFGNDRQFIWLGERRIPGEDKVHLLAWSDGRIDVKVPEDIAPGTYEIMVVKGGSSKIATKNNLPLKITVL